MAVTLDDTAVAADAQSCDNAQSASSVAAALRARLLAERPATELAATFRALGDPTRVRILDALSKAELCVCDLAGLLSLTESAVSHQLRLLRTLRLVRSRRAGRHVFYSLDDQHIVRLFDQGLAHVQEAKL